MDKRKIKKHIRRINKGKKYNTEWLYEEGDLYLFFNEYDCVGNFYHKNDETVMELYMRYNNTIIFRWYKSHNKNIRQFKEVFCKVVTTTCNIRLH